MLFNVNEKVRVKLTETGHQILRTAHADLAASFPSIGAFKPPATDKEGWSEFQLWDLMHIFGANCYNGCKVPFETAIDIPLPDTGQAVGEKG